MGKKKGLLTLDYIWITATFVQNKNFIWKDKWLKEKNNKNV